MTTPSVSVETVTPAIAKLWLASNTHNRKPNIATVAKYAGAMRRGEWDGHSQIVFSDDDPTVLLDGQHRLLAVVDSGVTIQAVVLRGADRSAQETIDANKPRSFGDVLTLRGEVNASALAAAVKILWKIQNGEMRKNHAYTTKQLLVALDEHPGLREHVSFPGIKTIRGIGAGVPTSVLVALHYIMHSIDSEDAEAFFSTLASGANLAEGSPIYALRRRMESTSRTKQGHNVRPAVYAAWIIKAWNVWRAGGEMSEMRWRTGGAAPEDFPAIDGWGCERDLVGAA